MSLQLQPYESLAWNNIVKTGFFHRNISEVQAVTNQRVIWNTIKHGDISIFLKDIGGCVILNQHSSAQYQSNAYYAGDHYRYSFGRSDSHQIGDVQGLHKQDNPSRAINNNPRDSVIVFAQYNLRY